MLFVYVLFLVDHLIVDIDEGDIENDDVRIDIDNELNQGDTSPNFTKKDELLSPNKEV